MCVLEAGGQTGDADGSEWRALLEAAMGKAGQANCTLLTAGRFLTGVDGGGGCPRELGSRCLTVPTPGQLRAGRAGGSCPPCSARAKVCWVGCLGDLTQGVSPQGHTPHSLPTHPGRFCRVLVPKSGGVSRSS